MNSIRIRDWSVETTGPVNDFCESVFFTGNGYLGVRGFPGWKPKERLQDHAIFKAGFFSHITPKITDMVQLPDVLTICPAGHIPTDVHQELNLKNGELLQEWQDSDFSFAMKRTVSMSERSLIISRLEVRALNSGHLNVQVIADGEVANLPVNDDQMVENTDLTQLLKVVSISENSAELLTSCESTPVHITWEIRENAESASHTEVSETRTVTSLERSMKAGEEWIIEKRIRIRTGGEPADGNNTPDPWEESRKAWERLWEDCDMEVISEDPELQGAVRYNIYQLLANNAAGVSSASTGARGLTHGRYKGNTFWDTDIFLLPFYLWTRPEAARNLMLYRTGRLEDAKALARKQNLEGARYPWMCSDTGMEQCESWDIGLCEVHITADVTYALDRYCRITGDRKFRNSIADNVFLETGRYWVSRLTWEPERECYSSFFVKGPDEYCGAAVNNTYTNWMARNNLRLAVESKLADENETGKLKSVMDHIAILYDPKRRLYLQDELFERLEPMKFSTKTDIPSYRSICFDRLQRYRALKQADLVLLATLYPTEFSREEKLNIFNTYEPLTLHDSTLSWGVHAQLALQLGLWDKAEDYLKKGIYLDLKDLMSNTGREGIHMAALGSAWQAVVYGAAGLWTDDDGITLNPMLPEWIKRLRFHVFYQGERYLIDVSHDNATAVKEVR